MSLIDRIDRLRLAYHDHVREVAWVDGVEDAYALVAPAPGPTELETARLLVAAIRALIDAAPAADRPNADDWKAMYDESEVRNERLRERLVGVTPPAVTLKTQADRVIAQRCINERHIERLVAEPVPPNTETWNDGYDAGVEQGRHLAAAPAIEAPLLARIAELETGRLETARLIVSYADLTHDVVTTGGDWRHIAQEWAKVVDAARSLLAPAQEEPRCPTCGHSADAHGPMAGPGCWCGCQTLIASNRNTR